MIKSIIFLPSNFSIKILKFREYTLLINNNFTSILIKLGLLIQWNKFCNTITIQNTKPLIFSYLNLFLKTYSIVNLEVIKFKGKGYKLTKKNNSMNFLFNFSHLNYYLSKKSILIKPHKSKFIIVNADPINLKKISLKLINIRLINKYTYNGLRLKRQLVFKRKGKTLST